jgi:glycosyltransferase involved in cell wall biosynthesis
MSNTPLVSITIPSYNSEKMIPSCLESVSKQTYPNIETLVIDSYSMDRTRDIASSSGAKVILCEVKLLAAIPQELIPSTIHGDHDIIYYESYRVSQRVSVLRDAVHDIEPDWGKLWRTNYRYGASLKAMRKSYYWDTLWRSRGSGLRFGRPVIPGLQTLLLAIIIKAINKLGYHFGHT